MSSPFPGSGAAPPPSTTRRSAASTTPPRRYGPAPPRCAEPRRLTGQPHAPVPQALLRNVALEKVKAVLLASPGFVREEFFNHLYGVATREGNRVRPAPTAPVRPLTARPAASLRQQVQVCAGALVLRLHPLAERGAFRPGAWRRGAAWGPDATHRPLPSPSPGGRRACAPGSLTPSTWRRWTPSSGS